jgi:hypothetical protein
MADLDKYGSVQKILEIFSQKINNLQSQTQPIEAKREYTNTLGNEIHEDSKSSDRRAGYPPF